MKNTFRVLMLVIVVGSIFSSCSTIKPLSATNAMLGSKIGTSQYTMFCGMAFNGDASIRTAAKNGGITKISTVDQKISNTLFIVITYKTVVTGE